MSDDTEIDAIRSAYACIKGLNRAQWTRALEYLATRMAEDDRASHITFSREDFPPPVQYVLAGGPSDPVVTPEEAVGQASYDQKIYEVNGVAVVSQRFAVEVNTDDGNEIEWFDTRDAAETFLAEMAG